MFAQEHETDLAGLPRAVPPGLGARQEAGNFGGGRIDAQAPAAVLRRTSARRRGDDTECVAYATSRVLARERRREGSDCFVYPSVRDAGGECVAAFWPDTVGVPIQERHLQYEWDGKRVARYFDYRREPWAPVSYRT